MSLVGTVLDERYEIISAVGDGGMGQVYLARETQLDRLVAVKVLHSLIADEPQSQDRFEREGRVMAALNHPNIVGFLRFGVWQNQPYIVMEYVEGITLKDLIVRGPLPWQRAIAIAEQICDAVGKTHEHGIIHRDLKPSNILLIDSDGHDLIKVMDFGLAGLLPDCGVPGQKLTQTGNLVGSLHYLSPEQACGQKPDYRADIYALGCIVYEAIAGVPPLDSDSPMSLVYKHARETPRPLGDIVKDPTLPTHLDAVLDRSMAKDPRDRYQTMRELKDDLELLTCGSLIGQDLHAARRIRTWRRLVRWPNMVMVASAFLVVSLIASMALPSIACGLLSRLPVKARVAQGLLWSEQLAAFGCNDAAIKVTNWLSSQARERHDLLDLAQTLAAQAELCRRCDPSESGHLSELAVQTLAKYALDWTDSLRPQELSTAALVARAIAGHESSFGVESIGALDRLVNRYGQLPELHRPFIESAADLSTRLFTSSDVRRAMYQCRLAVALARANKKDQALRYLREAEQALPRMQTPSSGALLCLCLISCCLDLSQPEIAQSYAARFASLVPPDGLRRSEVCPIYAGIQLVCHNPTVEALVLGSQDKVQRSPEFACQVAEALLSENACDRSLRLSQAIAKLDSAPLLIRARAALNEAYCWDRMLNPAQALKAAAIADAWTQKLLARNDEDSMAKEIRTLALSVKGNTELQLGLNRDAQRDFETGLGLSGTTRDGVRLSVLTPLIVSHSRQHNWAAMERLSRHIIDQSRVTRTSDWELAAAHAGLAESLFSQKRIDAGRKALVDATSSYSRLAPVEFRNHLTLRHGWSQLMMDRQDCASCAAQSLDVAIRAKLDWRSMIPALSRRAADLVWQRRYKEASGVCDRLWSEYASEMIGYPDTMAEALAASNEVVVALRPGDADSWRKLEQQGKLALAVSERNTCATEVRIALLTSLSIDAERLGKSAESQKYLQRAHALAGNSPTLCRTLFGVLRNFYVASGNCLESEKAGRSCLICGMQMELEFYCLDAERLAEILARCGKVEESKVVLAQVQKQIAKDPTAPGMLQIGLSRCLDELPDYARDKFSR